MSFSKSFDLNKIKNETLAMWESANVSKFSFDLNTYTYWEKVRNEKYIERCLDIFFKEIEQVPLEELKTSTFRKSVSSQLMSLILSAPFLSEDEKKYMTEETMLNATLDFVDRFYLEDGQLPIEDLGQALRNFWIGNLLQSCFEMPLKATTPLYHYSMLYPYTDNLLDDLSISDSQKKLFCAKLTKSLMGNAVDGYSLTESRIFELVSGIYEYEGYTSSDVAKVRESLLAIHDAQIASIQQHRTDLMPYEMDLLGQTFFKGGTSLLADGFIVNPEIDEKQMSFCYAYGAALQLCDDLQDLESDSLSGHFTLFSQLKGHYILDPLLIRLNGFLEALKTDLEIWLPEDSLYLSDVMIRNTKLLLMAAVVQHEGHFKRSFVTMADSHLPIRPKFMKKMNRTFKARLRKTQLSKAYALSV